MTTKEILLTLAAKCEAFERYIQDLEVRVQALEHKPKRVAKNTVSRELKPSHTTVVELSPTFSVTINDDLLEAWADTYPEEFLRDELKKARNWVLSNKHKAPRSQWGKFLNTWFNRSWEKYRLTLKSNPVMLTTEELEKILGSTDANP